MYIYYIKTDLYVCSTLLMHLPRMYNGWYKDVCLVLVYGVHHQWMFDGIHRNPGVFSVWKKRSDLCPVPVSIVYAHMTVPTLQCSTHYLFMSQVYPMTTRTVVLETLCLTHMLVQYDETRKTYYLANPLCHCTGDDNGPTPPDLAAMS